MKIIIKTALTCILIFYCRDIKAQYTKQQIQQKMLLDFDEIKKGSFLFNDYSINPADEKDFLQFYRTFDKDSFERIRTRVTMLKLDIARKTKDSLLRQEITADLTQCLFDPKQSDYAIDQLTEFFKAKDFNQRAKQNLLTIFNNNKYTNNTFIFVIGIANMPQAYDRLKKIAAGFDHSLEGWNRTPAWYATLALARDKVVKNIDNIITAVELDTNAIERVGTLLKHVAYTRHKDAARLFIKYLKGLDRLPNFVAEENKGLLYWGYVVEYVALYFDNFPIKSRGSSSIYTPEEIELTKKFLKNYIAKNDE